MRKMTLIAALAAASALVPAAAFAQDNERPHHERDGGQHGNGNQARAPRPETPRPQAQPQQGAPRVDAQRPQFQPRPDGQRPDRGPGANWRGGAPQAAPAAQLQAQQAQQNRGNWQRGDRFQGQPLPDPRGQGNPGWRGTPGTPGAGNGVNRPQGFGGGDQRGNDANNGAWRGNDRRPFGNGAQAQGFRGNNGAWNRGNAFSRDWRQDRRYDWSRYRSAHRDIFRLPQYYAPHGWNYGYRRFNIGFRLAPLLFAQDYWIDDPFYYQLPPVDGPYRWVRYYNDALLVDIYTGEVVDTVYDIFW